MNKETESKPVPRAERVTHYPNDDHWTIIPKMTNPYIVVEAELHDGIDPIGFVAVLIESAKLREHADRQQAEIKRLAEHDVKLKDFRIKVCRAIGLDPVYYDDVILEGIQELRTEKNARGSAIYGTITELLDNGNRVAAELGLPEGSGVDEVISAIQNQKTVLLAKLAREPGDQAAWGRAVQKLLEAEQQIANLGTFIGHPGATPAHVFFETVSLIDKLQASEMNCADLVANLRSLCDDSMAADREQILENVRAWKQRALAAEARLTGGPDEGPLSVQEAGSRIGKLMSRAGISKVESHPGYTLDPVTGERRGGPDEEKPYIREFYAQLEKGKDLLREWEKSMQKPDPLSLGELLKGTMEAPEDTIKRQTTRILDLQQRVDRFESKANDGNRELQMLRRFLKVTSRLHSIPSTIGPMGVLDGIAEYLEVAEKWRGASRVNPEDRCSAEEIKQMAHDMVSDVKRHVCEQERAIRNTQMPPSLPVDTAPPAQ